MKGSKAKNFFTSTEMLVTYIIIALCLAIGFSNHSFFTIRTLFDTSRSMLVTLIFALCEMVIIVSGGIDVSFPAIACFSSYLAVDMVQKLNINSAIVAFLLAGVIGLAWGALNAVLIAKVRIPPLIATLGTSSLANGLILIYSNAVEISNIPDCIDKLSKVYLISVTGSNGVKASITAFIILPIVLAVLIHWILRHTMLGRGIYAVGGDPVAAQVAGFNVTGLKFVVYMSAGFLTGIGGLTNAILLRDANPTSLMGAEMMIIAAVVIGGARLTGGYGNVVGTVLGVLLITLVSNNLIMMGVPTYWQAFAIGLIIVAGTSITSVRAKKIAMSPKI